MLNAEDALGLQEDLAIMRNNRNRLKSAALMADEAVHAGTVDRSLEIVEAAVLQLRADLSAANNNRNDLNAVAKATREVLNLVIDRWAEAIGLPVEQVRGEVFQAVSRRYDKLVEEALARGSISDDKRRDPEVMKQRDWYVAP